MKKIVVLLLALLLAVSAASMVSAEEPVQGGTFRWGQVTNPRGMFNPILYTEQYDAEIIEQIYDGLIDLDRNLQPTPKIAESWELSEDGLSLTFNLRKGVKFHDGVEVTAKDVAYTYMTILHPHYTGVRFGDFRILVGAEEYKNEERDDVPGIEVIDDYTIRFTTVKVHSPLLSQFTYGILPSHLLEDIPVADLETASFNGNPIGAGPFKFVEFKSDQYAQLVAFDDYYLGRPNIDNLVFQKVSDDAVPIYLQQGRVDYIVIAPEQYPEVTVLPGISVFQFEDFSYSYIAFNMRQERFADVRVRQAITIGFDRDTYIDYILEGFAIKANAPMPKASWAFTDEGINPYDYNPELAKEMLAEAGWAPGADGILEKDGMRMEFEFIVPEGTRTSEQMALLFQQNMAELGIKVELLFLEFNAAIDLVDAREFDIFTMGWGLTPDPNPYGIWHSSVPWNDPGFYHDRSDELIEMGLAETDQEKRAEIYAEWQRIVNYELPTMFLNYRVRLAALNQRVKGIDSEPGPFGPLVDGQLLRTIWLAD